MIIIAETFETALISLWRNKLRSFLTMLGIIIGVASVILLVSIGAGLQNYISGQFESLGSNLIFVAPGEIGGSGPPVSRLTLSLRDAQRVRRIGYPVAKVNAAIETFANLEYKSNEVNSSGVFGIEEEGFDLINLQTENGRQFTQSEINKNSRVAYLGPKVAEELFGRINPIGKTFLIQSSKYRVIGIFKSKGGGAGLGPDMDTITFIPITTAQKQFNQDKVTVLHVQAANADVVEDVKIKIEEELLKTHEEDDFSIYGQEELLDTITSILRVISAGLGGIAAISLLVGGIGIMNIMFVTVTERTREIGLRKALGATPRDILIQFLIESATVGLTGGTIGILIAMGGSIAINQYIASTITPNSILIAFGFSTIIGVIFGSIPAYQAAKLDPINALRYE